MGAINKNTNDYEYPRIANKSNKYKCPCCEKDVIFRNGKIKQPHFAHYKSESPCHYYDRPNETQIHKDAKLLMKSLLDGKKNIYITRNCNHCEQRVERDGGFEENIFDCISNDDYSENTHAVIEHRFNYNNSNKSADVALVENDVIKFIFEICYKNKTNEENRPEPWFEFNAEDLISKINSGEGVDEDGNVNIECIRNYKCDFCVEYEEDERQRREEHEKRREERERERIEARLRWENEQYEIQERWIREDEERQRQERVIPEIMKQLKLECGFDRIVSKVREPCGCDMCVCICENPKYELVKLSNNLFCVRCNKWKCRCENAI